MWLLCILLYGLDTMGIGYMAIWGFGAKYLTGWMGEWSGYPLDCYDYQSTCGAKTKKKEEASDAKMQVLQSMAETSLN